MNQAGSCAKEWKMKFEVIFRRLMGISFTATMLGACGSGNISENETAASAADCHYSPGPTCTGIVTAAEIAAGQINCMTDTTVHPTYFQPRLPPYCALTVSQTETAEHCRIFFNAISNKITVDPAGRVLLNTSWAKIDPAKTPQYDPLNPNADLNYNLTVNYPTINNRWHLWTKEQRDALLSAIDNTTEQLERTFYWRPLSDDETTTLRYANLVVQSEKFSDEFLTNTNPEPDPDFPIIPNSISQKMKDIYSNSKTYKNVFDRAGECMSATGFFLGKFDYSNAYTLVDTYRYLQDTITQFSGSFRRASTVANETKSARSVAAYGLWSELVNTNASILLINLGTNDSYDPVICGNEKAPGFQEHWVVLDRDFERNMRSIIDTTLNHKTIPILATKADQLCDQGRFNKIIFWLANEYEVPFWDFRQALQRYLPNLPTSPKDYSMGLRPDRTHLSWAPTSKPWTFDTLCSGQQVRNLTGLQALDAIWNLLNDRDVIPLPEIIPAQVNECKYGVDYSDGW
jgi:hypothetical protein